MGGCSQAGSEVREVHCVWCVDSQINLSKFGIVLRNCGCNFTGNFSHYTSCSILGAHGLLRESMDFKICILSISRVASVLLLGALV